MSISNRMLELRMVRTRLLHKCAHNWPARKELNREAEISVHAAEITGTLSFLVFKLGLLWGFLYLLVIPVGLIRIRLRQHTLLQVLAGAVLSAALTWAQIIFLVPLIPA